MSYRRRFVPGRTAFFTLRLQDHSSDLLVAQVDLLRQSVRVCQRRWPFVIDAAVILPATLHMIWTLPPGDSGYSARWRLIKSTFSRHVPAPPYRSASQVARQEKGIWQRRFWEHYIRDVADFDLHQHLIIHAPVQAGLVRRPRDWPHSSLHVRGVGLDPRIPYFRSEPLPRLHQSQIKQLL